MLLTSGVFKCIFVFLGNCFSIITKHAGYHSLLVHICLVRTGIITYIWPFSPNLFIWKAIFWYFFFHLSLISFKFIWIVGLLFSDMWVIFDTVSFNCFHFQYSSYIEPGRRRWEEMFKIMDLVWRFFVRFWALESTCSPMSVLHCPLLVCFTMAYIWSTPWPHFLFLFPPHSHWSALLSIQWENWGQTA